MMSKDTIKNKIKDLEKEKEQIEKKWKDNQMGDNMYYKRSNYLDEKIDELKKELDSCCESVNNDYTDLKLEIYESFEANLITESEKDELLNILENTAYNKHHALDVKTYPADYDNDTKTNSKEEGKYIAKQKAFNKEAGIKDDKFLDMDTYEARYIKDKQRRKIDRAVEANKAKKFQKDLNDPKKRGKYNVVLTGNGATLVDPRKERIKELKQRIADKKKESDVKESKEDKSSM